MWYVWATLGATLGLGVDKRIMAMAGKSVSVLFLFLLVLVWSGGARALSGQALLDTCEEHTKTRDRGTVQSRAQAFDSGTQSGNCIGYIYGVIESHDFLTLKKPSLSRFCMPRSVGAGHLIGVVLRHLKGDPQSLERMAAGEIAFALSAAFPCARRP